MNNFWSYDGIFKEKDDEIEIEDNIFDPLPFRLALDIIGEYFRLEMYPLKRFRWGIPVENEIIDEYYFSTLRNFYGYFKHHDRQRKLFVIFRSIQVNASFDDEFPVFVLRLLPLTNLEHLYLINGVMPIIHSMEDLKFVKFLKRSNFFSSCQIRFPKSIECFKSCTQMETLRFSVSLGSSESNQFLQNDVIDLVNETLGGLKFLKSLSFNIDYMRDSVGLTLNTDRITKYLKLKNLKTFLSNLHRHQEIKYFVVKNMSLERLTIFNHGDEIISDECIQYFIDNKNLKHIKIRHSRYRGNDGNNFPYYFHIYSTTSSELRLYMDTAVNLNRVRGVLIEMMKRRKEDDDIYLGFYNIDVISSSISKYVIQPNVRRIKKLFFRRCRVVEDSKVIEKMMLDEKKEVEFSELKYQSLFSGVDVFDMK